MYVTDWAQSRDLKWSSSSKQNSSSSSRTIEAGCWDTVSPPSAVLLKLAMSRCEVDRIKGPLVLGTLDSSGGNVRV